MFQIPPEIISVDEALLLRFKSDDTINSKGFSAAYVVIDDHDNFDDYGDVIGVHQVFLPTEVESSAAASSSSSSLPTVDTAVFKGHLKPVATATGN